MIMHRTKQRMTAEEFLHADHKGYELVGGFMREKNMGFFSSTVGAWIMRLFAQRFDWQRYGFITDAEGGYQCFPLDPDLVRKPDLAFIRRERLPGGKPMEGWCPVAPDFAIEILSKNNSLSEAEEKVEEYLAVNVPWVWVVDPKKREVHVYRPGAAGQCFTGKDELRDDQILPGFACHAEDLFPPA